MRLAVFCFAAAFAAAPFVSRAADVAAGKAVFDRTCHNCHSLEAGMNKVGPSLFHVVGRPSATIDGFMYSDAMRNLRTVWTVQTLNAYLQNPRDDVKGVKMNFRGLPDAEDRANVIAYLQSLSDQ